MTGRRIVGWVFETLASVPLTIALLAIFAIAIAVATLVEGDVGTAGAKALVYNARWFEGLLILLTVNLVFALIRRTPFRARQTGFIIVHIAMIVILVGAGMTRYLGYEGSLHIREGQQNDTMLSRETHVQVTVGEESTSFPVRLYRGGGPSWSREFTLGGTGYRVSVQDFWAHYSETPHRGPGGQPSLDILVSSGEVASVTLDKGAPQVAAGLNVAFRDETVLTGVADPRFGRLEVRVGEATASLPVPEDLPADLTVGDHRFTITEFQADFTVDGPGDPVRRMTNPMIRVGLTGPGGETEERMLFAYYPEFARQHGRGEASLGQVQTDYVCAPSLVFGGEGDSVVARASFALVVGEEGTPPGPQVIAPGREFRVVPRATYRTQNDGLRVMLQASRGTAEVASREDPDAPPAALLRLEDLAGATFDALRLRGAAPRQGELGDVPVSLAYGPVPVRLPHALALDDFRLLTYPGSEKPSGYESHVRLVDPAHGIEGRPVVIRMNSPLTHGGFKHFQSSYDNDHLGTILTVNYDPGKWPTYLGYILITVGFLLSLFKNVELPRPPNSKPAPPRSGGAS